MAKDLAPGGGGDNGTDGPAIGRSWAGGEKPDLNDLMTTHPVTGERGIFIFAYGSLCANPPPGQTNRYETAITGFRRDFAVQDIFYRGTEEKPGLTLGLDVSEGTVVPGAVYFAPESSADKMLDEVHRQETPKGMEDIYRPQIVETNIGRGKSVPAMAYMANPESALYVGQSLSKDEKAAQIASSYGIPNNDYAKRTRPEGRIGKTDLEYLAMTSINLEDAQNGDAYLSSLTELAVQKREEMINSGDPKQVQLAGLLAEMEQDTAVEKAFKDRIGVDVVVEAASKMRPGAAPKIDPGAAANEGDYGADQHVVSTEGVLAWLAEQRAKKADLGKAAPGDEPPRRAVGGP
ncbi:MAG: gamma-glutamylcyclotransferase [Alphaproteobacteria bacterium]|nr:gamma-glutamylcyclotransferase [Alphaproteobacteria bacterium SS10]